MYETGHILDDLGMTIQTFREIAVLSGTDYNCDKSITLWDSIRLYGEYKKQAGDSLPTAASEDGNGFYDWLMKTTKHIQDYDTLVSIVKMFDITNYKENEKILLELSPNIGLGAIQMDDLTTILEKDGFVFVQ
jgi:hypothetical protein